MRAHDWRYSIWISLGGVAVLTGGFVAWIFTLPQPLPASAAPVVPTDEVDATLAALRPPKRARPLIAIVGINDGTELTDYLVPLGVLRRSDCADVVALATGAGPVRLFPAQLAVVPDATIAEFDQKYPGGADYVIVPAMSRDDDPVVIRWLQTQAEKHATVVGVCAGAKVVAAAGLLDGRRATTHWYYLKALCRSHPTVQYVPNRRIVTDERIATITGITASIPLCLTLIEAIAGRHTAESTARDLGVAHWDIRHMSGAFQFTRPFAVTALHNRLAFWNHEQVGLELTPGVDEVALALVADAWSRTFRSRAVTFARTQMAVPSRNGIRLLGETAAARWPAEKQRPELGNRKPAEALDQTLREIGLRYGEGTANFVAMQLEYPRDRTAPAAPGSENPPRISSAANAP